MSSASPDRPAAGSEPPEVDDAGGSLVALPGVAVATAVEERSAPNGASAATWSRPPWAVLAEEEAAAAAASSRRRRRWGIVAAVSAVLLVLLGVEVLGRRYIAGEVRSRIAAGGISGDVRVSIGDGLRPVVLPVLFGSGVDRLTVRISNGVVGGLPVRRADYDLRGIDGAVSLLHGSVDVRSISSGAVRIEVDPAALGSVAGTPMRIDRGRLVAGPDRTPVTVKVDGDSIVLGGEAEAIWGGPLSLPIVDEWLLPCRPRVRVAGGSLVLSCRGTTVPGVLRDPLGGQDLPEAPTGDLAPPQSTVLGGTGGGTDAGPGTADPTTTIPEPGAPATSDGPAATEPPPASTPPEAAPGSTQTP